MEPGNQVPALSVVSDDIRERARQLRAASFKGMEIPEADAVVGRLAAMQAKNFKENDRLLSARLAESNEELKKLPAEGLLAALEKARKDGESDAEAKKEVAAIQAKNKLEIVKAKGRTAIIVQGLKTLGVVAAAFVTAWVLFF